MQLGNWLRNINILQPMCNTSTMKMPQNACVVMENEVILYKVPSLLHALTMILTALDEHGHDLSTCTVEISSFSLTHITSL